MEFNKLISLIVISLLMNGVAFCTELLEARLKEVLPSDAAEYVSRYRICQHWQGEPPYDKDRATEIKKGITETCGDLDKRKQSLETKYPPESNERKVMASILKEVDAGNSMPSFVFNDPERKSKVLDEYYRSQVKSISKALAEQLPRHERAVKLAKEKKTPPTPLEKLETTVYLLNVQKRYLQHVLENKDRLDNASIKQMYECQQKITAALDLAGSVAQPNQSLQPTLPRDAR